MHWRAVVKLTSLLIAVGCHDISRYPIHREQGYEGVKMIGEKS